MRKLLAAAGAACIIVAIILLKWVLLAPEPRQGGPQPAGAVAKGAPSPSSAVSEPESGKETVEAPRPAKPGDPRLYEESVFVEDWWLPAYEELAKADARIGTAKDLLSQGNYEGAILLMEEIISTLSGTEAGALAHLIKGICLWGLGDREDALAEYETVILEYPDSVAAWEAVERFGLYHLKAYSVLEGMEWIADVLEADPANQAARKAKWELITRAARMATIPELEELWGICMDGLKEGGETIDAYEAGLALAESLRRVNREKMGELLEEIAEHCPDPSIAGQAKLELANIYSSWDPKSAVRLAQEVLASSANEWIKKEVRRRLAIISIAEDVLLAQDTFEQVLTDGWTEDELCSCLTEMGLAAVRSRTDGWPFRSWLEEIGGVGGKVGEHALMWKAFLEDPEDDDVLQYASFEMLRLAGRAHQSRARFDLAESLGWECLAKSEAYYPGDMEKYLQSVDLIANAMAARSEYDEAAAIIGAALERYPNEPDTAVWAIQLARHLQGAGRLEESVAEFQRIADEYPGSVEAPRALLYAGMVSMDNLNDLASAREYWQRVLDAYPDSSSAETAREWLEDASTAEQAY